MSLKTDVWNGMKMQKERIVWSGFLLLRIFELKLQLVFILCGGCRVWLYCSCTSTNYMIKTTTEYQHIVVVIECCEYVISSKCCSAVNNHWDCNQISTKTAGIGITLIQLSCLPQSWDKFVGQVAMAII